MDNQIRREGRLIVLVDKSWREDIQNLPFEDISVPVQELPDPEPDNCNPLETLKEQEPSEPVIKLVNKFMRIKLFRKS
ncbi:Anaphase-promoting complex subunit 13-like protein [Leptotrombidium deliense]|uniref:Anaphase-promoting complex subunit 13-like protein n=1 Tax=Leptotrombidium deliense TaxID=299467 RepID=A0A443SJ42_9ACAR|nr:Anaphase-promoting complex subunit 13-like protein [Leptotrombidium deliense]